ncbi:MAG: phage minor head protein [Cyanobacteriota bacterium]
MKQTILKILQQQIPSGQTAHNFTKIIKNNLDNITIPKTQLEALYHTYHTYYYSHIRYKQMYGNITFRQFWQYEAVIDPSTNPLHKALDGKVLKFNDPFWQFFFPPNDYNCRCSVRAFNERDIQRKNLIVETSKNKLFITKTNNKDIPVFIDDNTGLNISPHTDWCFNISEKPFVEVETMILNHYLN